MGGMLTGRTALITGGSRGIGRAIAERFAEQGADVAVTARSADALKPTIEAVSAAGTKAIPLVWNAQDVQGIDILVEEACAGLGTIDILISNAGAVRLPADCQDASPEAEWDYILDVNLKGLFFLCERVAELMKTQQKGTIVNLASDAGLRGAPTAYGISKWGVIGYTRGLAKKLAPHHVRVNAVAPGPVATAMMGCTDGEPKPWQAGPLGRYSLPAEVADVALFLASDASRAVFGQTIVVNSADW